MVKLFGKFKNDNDTGFGASASNQAERLINKDGSYNVTRTGVSFLNKLNTYHDLIALSWFKFNLLVLAVYLLMNFIFTFIYWIYIKFTEITIFITFIWYIFMA